MKPYVERSSVAGPCAIVALCEGAAVPETDANGLGLGCDNAEFNAAFGVDLRILFAALIGRRGFPVIRGFVGLGTDKLA